MRKFLTLILSIIFLSLKAQDVKIFYEKQNTDFVLYASNNEGCPVSISIELNLTNLTFSEGEKKVFIIPSKTDKFKIGELTTSLKGIATQFNFKYLKTLGDVSVKNYDKDFEYDLPFPKNKSYKVFQGYNGTFSHQNENAIDFTMAEGSEILAARGGIVVKIVQDNTQSCPEEECKKYNNYITILHSDGTFATYAHIRYNGSKVKLADKVNKGDTIAYSGKVGWTTGPHLHFVCYIAGFDKWNSFETKFKIDNGDKTAILSEGNFYSQNY